MGEVNENLKFGLVHGAWHGAWCWGPFQEVLKNLGHESVAVDLPIDDPDANFKDYTEAVIEGMKDAGELVLVGHSRGGNVLPRAAGSLSVKKLIFLCSSFEPATIDFSQIEASKPLPPRNFDEFKKGIIPTGHDMTIFNKQMAGELFFHDCSPEVRDWAVKQFRAQRRSDDEPEFHNWPAIPKEYIYASQDRILNPDWSKRIARESLGIEPTEFESGHSPFLSKPRELAELLIYLSA